MAGGKESPRQRMIGMMYLVLTALLALQVSNQILQKFVLINDGLERTSKNYILKNEFAVESIKGTVEQQGNNQKDIPKVKIAEELRKKTAEVFNYLESMKQEVITASNAKDDNGMYKTSALKNVDVPGNIFSNNKKGFEMQEILNRYPEEVSLLLKEINIDEKFSPIAKNAGEIDLFKNDPDVKNKNFVELMFVKSPIGAVLTLISQFQNEVLNVESESLEKITSTIGSFYYKADIVQARIAALSNVVAAGTKFEADMFIASSSSSDAPRMTVDGTGISVENGFGKIEFTATPGQYDDRGLSRRVIKGEIVTNVGGEDQILPIEYEYFVAQPVIRVTSEVVNQLYADCANDLMIDVPALGNSYSPAFSVSNGTAISGTRPGQVTIIPGASGKTLIGVSSGGNRIGDVSYDIKPVPMPTIVPATTQGPIDLIQGVAPIQTILVKALAEPTFARTMARDAKFEVTGGEVSLIRSEVPRGSVNITGESVSIRNLAEQAKTGDRLIVRVTEITRTNFQSKKVRMPLSQPMIMSFPIR